MPGRETKQHNKGNKEKAVPGVTAAERTALERHIARLEAKRSVRLKVSKTPVAAFVREIMAVRSTWTGRASDLLRARIAAGEGVPDRTAGWPKNPRALAGRLRRCQTFLRTVGIDIAFSREGRTGSRMIRITSLTKSRRTSLDNWSGGLSENVC